jgi:hypothetical protein
VPDFISPAKTHRRPILHLLKLVPKTCYPKVSFGVLYGVQNSFLLEISNELSYELWISASSMGRVVAILQRLFV